VEESAKKLSLPILGRVDARRPAVGRVGRFIPGVSGELAPTVAELALGVTSPTSRCALDHMSA